MAEAVPVSSSPVGKERQHVGSKEGCCPSSFRAGKERIALWVKEACRFSSFSNKMSCSIQQIEGMFPVTRSSLSDQRCGPVGLGTAMKVADSWMVGDKRLTVPGLFTPHDVTTSFRDWLWFATLVRLEKIGNGFVLLRYLLRF